uniref:Serine-threonine/tyrosine-protein kinase catalytic domain-containing protein n=1 Tax=Lactuca sativa TaxID=4236 RepID=A0A9R1V9Y7_LACSA|nr:hypothetical protein LSAT_V11C600326760 [Lactuca sativa]
MGLSKIGPANHKNTFFATNVVGTFGYLDPIYMEMSILTKESDVYSFVLCGRLCFENPNGHSKSLLQKWKQSYKKKRLGKFSIEKHFQICKDIAYRCFQKNGEERPHKSHVVKQLEIVFQFPSHVVEKLEIVLWVQEIFKGMDYEVYKSKA